MNTVRDFAAHLTAAAAAMVLSLVLISGTVTNPSAPVAAPYAGELV